MANTPQIPHMPELQTADICERKGKCLSKSTPRFQADFAGLILTPKSAIGNTERYLLGCQSFPITKNSVLSGFGFSLLVDIHDWTEAKHDCKSFSSPTESPDAKETYSCLSSAYR